MRNFRMASLLVAPLIAASLILPGKLLAQNVVPLDSIVALVEEDVILRSELDDAIARIISQIRAQGGNMPPQNLIESQVLERVIMSKLQVQRAMRTGIRVSDSDIDQALQSVAGRNQISVTQLRQAIESEGEDFSEFRKSLGEEILTQRLQQRVVNSMDPISDTEIDILLASEDFAGGEYNISHIMVGLMDGSTPAQISEAQTKINDIHRQLDEGLDFASAAISFSDSQEALEGGVVGWRDLNSIPKEFADGIRELTPGQYSETIRSPAGFHIVKVNDFRENAQVTATEYRANHLLIMPNELLTEREAMTKVRNLHDELVGGADFAEIARQNSDDQTSANIGGDMGWFQPQSFGERFNATLAAMEDGEISEPFQTEIGWHIIQRVGYRETDVTEEAMRNAARQTIMQRRSDSEVESYLRQMREEAFVEIRLPS